MALCKDKPKAEREAIPVKYVSWENGTPADVIGYNSYAIQDMKDNNTGWTSLAYKNGRLTDAYFNDYNDEDCDEKRELLKFRITKNGNTEMINQGDGHLVVRPCPPFCDAGIEQISRHEDLNKEPQKV